MSSIEMVLIYSSFYTKGLIFFPNLYILFDMHLLENRIYITNSPAIMDMRTFVAKCVIL